MSYWIDDNIGWILGAVTVALIVLVVWATHKESQALTDECNSMMQMARSSRDSLDVRIACNKMRSDWETRIAISAAAGVVAGSNASRR